MNKILNALLISLLVLSSVIAGDLSIINVVDSNTGNPGTNITGKFDVRNNGNAAISTITFAKSDLVHQNDPSTKILSTAITLNPTNIASLNAGASNTIDVSVSVPQSLKAGSYINNIEVRDAANAHTISTPFKIIVNSMPKISVETFTATNPLTIKEDQGATATGSFVIKNDGNTVLANLDISHAVTIADNDNDTINLQFDGKPASLNAGTTTTITVRASISDNVDYGTYSGIVTAKDTVQNVQSTFKLDILVEPLICEDGVRSDGNTGGDNLRVDIRDPKLSENFAPGEEISSKVNVRNNDNSDLDVVVSAFIYDLDESEIVAEIETESQNIKDKESENFEFTLTVPSDVDVNNNFAFFVKAFEEDEEDINCGESRQKLELKRERHSVLISKLILSPTTLACGETFDATIDIVNIGTSKEDDVVVKLSEDDLRLNQVSNTITLDKFDDSNDKMTVRFRDIKIPENLEQKQYQIEALISYDGDKSNTKFGSLTVNKCDATTTTDARKASLQILVSTFTLQGGESVSIPATVTNADKVQTQYIVEMQNAQDFASSVPAPKTLILNPGQSETVYFNLITKDNLNSGKYTGTVVVKSGNNVLDTKAVTINAEKTGTLGGFNMDLNISKALWIAADIILVIIAIFFIKLIFGKRRKTE